MLNQQIANTTDPAELARLNALLDTAQKELNSRQAPTIASDNSLPEDGNVSTEISNEDLFLVETNGVFEVIAEQDLDQKMSNLSSTITQENIVLNNLKKDMAMTNDKKEQDRIENEISQIASNISSLKREMNSLLDASTVNESLANNNYSKKN